MFKKILVCLDGSELAENILPYALEEGEYFESELVLFRVFSEPAVFSLNLPGMPSVQVDAERTERRILEDEKETQDYLKKLADKLLAEKRIKVSYDSREGSAGPMIVDYAANQGIELIAIATHGRTGPGRVMLGSVAEYVIRHSGLPMLLIRPKHQKE